ncbi:MAG: polysaccharide biosynthesis C-terminal domain-containing protein, partial [Proteobacteria bacterium]|nr:polysaccharide biosynthesis C-terminal domain-containing protein [Pseudomonadota bacterium]
FWVGLLLLPLLSLLSIMRATMMGFQRVVVGQVPDLLVQPVFFAILLGVVALVPVVPVNAPTVVGLSGISALVALLSAVVILRIAWPEEIGRAKPEYFLRAWMRSAGTFVTISGLNVVGTSLGVIMLGSMSGAQAAGVFGIANAAAALIVLPLVAINTPLAPAVSTVFSESNKVELQRLATKAARSAFLLCLPLALIYVLFGKHLLWVFGEEFTAGYTVLVILTVGQMFNAAMGSVGVLLQMTGHERDVAVVRSVAVALNLILNLVLIPRLGIAGAALGATASMIFWNSSMAFLVHRRLGIRCTIVA